MKLFAEHSGKSLLGVKTIHHTNIIDWYIGSQEGLRCQVQPAFADITSQAYSLMMGKHSLKIPHRIPSMLCNILYMQRFIKVALYPLNNVTYNPGGKTHCHYLMHTLERKKRLIQCNSSRFTVNTREIDKAICSRLVGHV